ncbi:amidohydrolase family protein [Liberiplasma polymorphum]|uniref:amidohydrolase family protein n=1 Tax=Liberiplasma polymorphum TaxID=3374570 RepID=UPI003772D8F0
MSKAIIHAKLYDFHQFIDDAYVIFDERIIDFGPMQDFENRGYELIDGKNHIIMPSLISGHTHIYSTFARGISLAFNPKNFQEILDQLWWKIDGHLNNEMIYYSGIVSAVDMIKNGITTIIDHHASGIDIEGSLEALKSAVCDEASLRGCFAFETSDRFDVDTAIKENIQFLNTYKSDKTRGMFGLHASLSLSDKTLNKVKNHLGDYPIHIHVAESKLDQEDSLKKYKKRVIERLDDFDLLNRNSILTHALYVDDDELRRIKKRECVIAVNISSNMNNGVGLPPVKRFLDFNIPVIIGNDGISSSMTTEYLALYYAMHLKDQSPVPFGLDDLLEIIKSTYQYASECFNVSLGKIQKDYQADLLLIPYNPPTPLNASNAFGHLFFGLFNSFKPKHVFVDGDYVLKNYKVSETLETQYNKASHFAEILWKNIEKEA